MNHTIQNNSGSVLVASLILLAILTVMGITGITTSSTEIRIAANDMRHKQVFYQADGGTQVAVELIEQSFGCGGSLPETLTMDSAQVQVLNPNFAQPDTDTGTKDLEITSENGQFTTEIRISGKLLEHNNTTINPASAQEYILYDIRAQCRDSGNHALAKIKVYYRHVLGQDIPCPYGGGSVSHSIPGTLKSGIISWETIE